jgi:chromosomal replication initiator protein
MVLPTNVAHYVASQVESNIRELEGYLIRISAFSSITGKEIDINLTKEVLKKILKRIEREEVTIEEIIKTIAAKLNVKVSDIKSQKKNKNLVFARQIAMYLARKLTALSFPDIGEKVGGRDHSTVIYANNKIKKACDEDKNLKKIVQEIEEALQQRG